MTPERFRLLQAVLAQRQPDLTILAENVHKPHNVSALIRTCDAVGVMRLNAVSDGGELRRYHMVSGGSKKWVALRLHDDIEDAVATLHQEGFTILAAHISDRSVDFRSADYTVPTAILVGSELVGVSELAAELADGHIVIPMQGLVASLNVSVAAALILFEAQRQRLADGQYRRRKIPDSLYETLLFEWAHPDIARRCKDRGLSYPALDDDGNLVENPF